MLLSWSNIAKLEVSVNTIPNGAPRAKARGSPWRNTRAAIAHLRPEGRSFWPRKYKVPENSKP